MDSDIQDLIIWCLKHSLEILEKEWEDELKEDVFAKYKEMKLLDSQI